MDWIQSVQRAVNYIEDHILDRLLDNEGVARQVYSSSANFQRVFTMVTGVTVADYIRYRRLTLAGRELSGSDAKILDTALKYGYDTPESFSKAFARFHGVTPSEARRNPAGLRNYAPIRLRIEIQGGFDMSTRMIPNIPPIVNSWFGENYHFNGVARYVMGCLGEMKLADYSLIAGLTGDIFTQFYPLGSFKDDSASDYHLGLRGLPGVFDKLGYTAEAFSENDLRADRERYLPKIVASIDRGIPVIWYHGWPKAAIIGYEDDGGVLLYISSDKKEPERIVLDKDFYANPQTDLHGWIVVGAKQREVSLRQLYHDGIARLPELLTTRTADYALGAEAFRAWADDLDSGRYEAMKPEEFEGNFFAYEVYIVNMATNSGGCQAFLEKAQEMNPDLTFLEQVRRQYRITNYLWNGGYWVKDVHSPEERAELADLYGPGTLEALGGAFGCKLETLRDKAKRAPIVERIRQCAACMDEVVRLVRENMRE